MSDEFKQASCAGKDKIPTPQAAAKAARNQRRRGVNIEAYRCQFCKAWHVGEIQKRNKIKPRAGI